MRTHSLDSPIASEIVVHGLSEPGGRTTVTYNDSCPLAGKQARAELHLAQAVFCAELAKLGRVARFSTRSRGMRQLVMQLVTVGRRRRATALALLVPLTLSAAPASAQDVFGFLRLFSSPTAREPVYQPHEFRALPELAPRTIRRRPKVVRTDPPKIPIKPKAPGEVTNPVPQLPTAPCDAETLSCFRRVQRCSMGDQERSTR